MVRQCGLTASIVHVVHYKFRDSVERMSLWEVELPHIIAFDVVVPHNLIITASKIDILHKYKDISRKVQ